VGADAQTRRSQDEELRHAGVRFELIEALESGGKSVRRMCGALGYELDPRTFLLTYLVALCAQAKLPAAQIVFEFHEDGVLDRLAAELEPSASGD
jgi:hypothetical protein